MRATALLPMLLLLAACGGSSDTADTSADCSSPDAAPVEGAADAGTERSAGDASNDSRETSAEPDADADAVAVGESSAEAALEASPDTTDDAPDATNEVDAGGEAEAGETVPDAPAETTITSSDAASGCNDNRKNGDETDIDCGGSCPPCGLGQACLGNADCGSWSGCNANKGGCACDTVSMTCVVDHCVDHHQDIWETAIDCGGGECGGCAVDQPCELDSDCASSACDLLSDTCAADRCTDHKRDGYESEVDCGGGTCPGCALGLHCGYDYDCASKACDVIAEICVTDACADHHMNHSETDVDCGGPDCGQRCDAGHKCKDTSDCSAGYVCNPGTPHVCY